MVPKKKSVVYALLSFVVPHELPFHHVRHYPLSLGVDMYAVAVFISCYLLNGVLKNYKNPKYSCRFSEPTAWYSEGAVPPTVTNAFRQIYLRRYGAPAVPQNQAKATIVGECFCGFCLPYKSPSMLCGLYYLF